MGPRPGVLLLTGLFAFLALSGCAMPRTPDERLAADVAVCRRHAAEGAGGPSNVVGGRSLNTVNPSSMQKLSHLRPAQSLQEIVYWECLRQRGYSVPHDNDRPIDPDAVGTLARSAIPA